MGLNNAMDISVSAINAERMQMELISSNIANINTTRTPDGGTYTRKMAVFTEKPLSFEQALVKAQQTKGIGGVEVKVVDDKSNPYQKVYNPSHPHADADGYVMLPNVSIAQEMADMVYANKLYETNINVFTATKKMAQDTLQIQ